MPPCSVRLRNRFAGFTRFCVTVRQQTRFVTQNGTSLHAPMPCSEWADARRDGKANARQKGRLCRISSAQAALWLKCYVYDYFLGGRLRISLASSGVAISLPSNFAISTAFATIWPLLSARTPFSM